MDDYGFVAFFLYPWLARSRRRVKEMPISKVKSLDMGQFEEKKKRPEVWRGHKEGLQLRRWWRAVLNLLSCDSPALSPCAHMDSTGQSQKWVPTRGPGAFLVGILGAGLKSFPSAEMGGCTEVQEEVAQASRRGKARAGQRWERWKEEPTDRSPWDQHL